MIAAKLLSRRIIATLTDSSSLMLTDHVTSAPRKSPATVELSSCKHMQALVFVGGVHGAGKSSICRALETLLPASHVTAGGLIRENAGDTTVTVGAGNKAVPNIDANQLLLLRGLELYRARADDKPILLDGHFSLLNANGKVVAIPLAVYESLAPLAVVFVEADVATVRKRRVERDGDAPPLDTISLLSARERENANTVCEALGIRIISVRGDGDAEPAARQVASALREILEGAA